MTKPCKAVLLAALGLASVTAAQAQTVYPTSDLIVGFSTGTGTDMLYDLGPASALSNGQSWDLTSILSGYGSLSSVNWGVIGSGPKSGSPRTLYTTTAVGSTTVSITGNTTFNTLYSAVSAIYQNFPTAGIGMSGSDAASDTISWNTETISGTLNGDYVNAFENPNVTGPGSDSFFSQLNDGSAATPLGGFTLGTDDSLTYNAVPEPSTCALLTMAGVAAVSLRNKFRKQA